MSHSRDHQTNRPTVSIVMADMTEEEWSQLSWEGMVSGGVSGGRQNVNSWRDGGVGIYSCGGDVIQNGIVEVELSRPYVMLCLYT